MGNRKKVDQYVIHMDCELGKGAVGSVYICYHRENPSQPVAVKVINKSITQHNEYLKEAIHRQFKVHQQLSHPNVVKLIEYKTTANHVYIFQEFCDGGNMGSLLKKNTKFSEQEVIYCAKSIVGGFTELVKKGIIHRDLKPDNLLINQDQIKICDFGYSKQIVTQKQYLNSIVGSPIYMCPQILKGDKYSSKCDVWSFGIMLYEMLFGCFPWGNRNKAISTYSLFMKITTEPLVCPNPIQNKHLKNLIEDCLVIQESERLSWLQIFGHELFEGEFIEEKTRIHQNMLHAAHLLEELAANITLEKLAGAFLSCATSSLDFQAFERIIKWLIPVSTPEQIGYMYEFFDKDLNGVVDIEEFINAFEICDPRIPTLLNKLMTEQKMLYDELKDQTLFMNKSSQYSDYPQEIVEETWKVINFIDLKDS